MWSGLSRASGCQGSVLARCPLTEIGSKDGSGPRLALQLGCPATNSRRTTHSLGDPGRFPYVNALVSLFLK